MTTAGGGFSTDKWEKLFPFTEFYKGKSQKITCLTLYLFVPVFFFFLQAEHLFYRQYFLFHPEWNAIHNIITYNVLTYKTACIFEYLLSGSVGHPVEVLFLVTTAYMLWHIRGLLQITLQHKNSPEQIIYYSTIACEYKTTKFHFSILNAIS